MGLCRAQQPQPLPHLAPSTSQPTSRCLSAAVSVQSNFEDTRGLVSPWTAVDTGARYQLVLDEQYPINAINPVSLQVVSDSSATTAGVLNPGWYGINCSAGLLFDGSLYVRSLTITSIDVALVDASSPDKVLAVTSLAVGRDWQKHNFTLTASADGMASFRITWQTVSAADRINFDVVTLFPRRGWMGLPWLRPDLAAMVAAMHPAFVRFPGGCFVEGQIIANRFNWKRALGPIEHRAGHWNLWGYWNEDGLAYFEFLQLIERLTDSYGQPSRAIWVVNNGISHEESIGPNDIQPYIQDALDSLEFAMGSADSYWGAQRAAMGHTEPFTSIYAVAIGNEDCGKDSYADNYQLFYDQLSAAYPHIKLISNCDPLDPAIKGHPTQMWVSGQTYTTTYIYTHMHRHTSSAPSSIAQLLAADPSPLVSVCCVVLAQDYHIYTSADQLFKQAERFFDDSPWRTRTTAKVFNSEYAVTDGAGHGNMRAAAGEAGWMNGLERNSDLVTTASYAPMFVNQAAPGYKWEPDAINFNSAAAFGTPSYWNQVMYADSFQGCVAGSVRSIAYSLSGATNVSVAVALGSLNPATAALKAANAVLVHKIVNYQASAAQLAISITGLPTDAQLNPSLDVTLLHSDEAEKENSFDSPTAIAPIHSVLKVDGPQFTLDMPAWSIHVIKAYVTL